MTYNRNPAKLYRQVQTEVTDEKHLIVLLFDGAVRLLQDGRRHLAARDYERWADCSHRARRVLSELLIALDESAAPELCRSLKALYVYVQRLITEAGLEEDMGKLQEAIKLLTQLATAWKEAKKTCQNQVVGQASRLSSDPQQTL